ncbi:hypothetical protein BDW59DRAFT_181803 [Aspergillus cavernicola]|uniref:Myb-like domain-containing protein n=1 Tax=Aspergillus cavernicola TaxID=176166 RepID=A0ABR4IVP6_9EURO
MLHVFVGANNPSKDFTIDNNLIPSALRSFVLPIDSFGNVIQAISFEPRPKFPQQSQSTLKGEQLQMGSQVVTAAQCSSTPNGLPTGDLWRREVQTDGGQYSHWHVYSPMVGSGRSDLPNTCRSRTASQSPHHSVHREIDHPSPNSHFTAGDIGSSNGNEPTPDLIHPIPRQSSYTVTSFFASDKTLETTSAFDVTESPHNSHLSDGDKYLMQGSDWTSNDLTYPCVFESSKSPGTTLAITETKAYPATVTDGTFDSTLMLPWPSLKVQVPWDVQQHNASQDEDEIAWDNTETYSSIDQQPNHFDQPHATTDDINGLPWPSTSGQTYIQPSSLLDPYKPTCPGLKYPNGNAVAPSEHSQIQSSADNFAYQNDPRPDDTTYSLLESYRHTSYEQDYASRSSLWTNDSRNAFLLDCKHRGYSYKDIKRIGGFKEAESTLRGRFRTLTKAKEQRVRKPQWLDNDVRLLCEAVKACSEGNKESLCVSACRSRRPVQPPKVSWKKVAQHIWAHGGSYHFGNATCKKKWCEVQSRMY